ncbi:hypothetical protein DL765_002771 [Monosporascus sp. GIB2]|nr:hypothetical protein DL765_002771 [Monosporascus sp. GIB2]
MVDYRNDHAYEKAPSSDEDRLSSEESEGFLNKRSYRPALYASSRYRLINAAVLICSGLLNVLLVGFIAYMYSRRGPSNPIFPQSLYSPLQDVIRYKAQLFTSGFGDQITKYMGNSTAADEAWKALYPQTVVRIPKSMADQLPNKTIPLNGDEDHFPVLISVFHELHCLDSIRHIYFGHTEGFDENPVINEAILAPEHIDHCFDSLRQTLMCGADISPMPYKWTEERQKALGYLDVQHTCRDYDALLDWAGRPEHDISGWDETIKPTSIP